MKKIAIVVITGIVALGIIYFVGTGFMKQTSVMLTDYAVSEDGKKITLNVDVACSIGFIRECKDEGGGIKPHYLKFYSTFGGFNSSLGSKNSFVLELAPEDTEIYFYQGDGGYKLVLDKNEQTGEWEVSK